MVWSQASGESTRRAELGDHIFQKSSLFLHLFHPCHLSPTVPEWIANALLVPNTNRPFSSADDLIRLVKRKELTFVAPNLNMAFYQKVLFGKTSTSTNLRKAVAANPIRIERNMTKILELVQFHRHIYCSEFHRGMILAQQYCELSAIVVSGLVWEGGSFIFRKNDPRVGAISEVTRTSLNFIRYVTRKYQKLLQNKCERREKSTRQVKKLDLGSLSGSFLLIVAGTIFGCTILLAERIHSYVFVV